MLDNDARVELKRKIIVIGFVYQLAPNNIHLENNTEQEINTLNNHFLLGMCKSNTNCTLKLCHHLTFSISH